MGLAPRISTSWASLKIENSLGSPRASAIRTILALLAGCFITYLLLLPVFYLFQTIANLGSQPQFLPMIHEPGEEQVSYKLPRREAKLSPA